MYENGTACSLISELEEFTNPRLGNNFWSPNLFGPPKFFEGSYVFGPVRPSVCPSVRMSRAYLKNRTLDFSDFFSECL